MAKKKKKTVKAADINTKTNGLIRRLKKLPGFAWVLAVLAAFVLLFGPVAADFVLEQQRIAQGEVAGTGKMLIDDAADLLSLEEEQLLVDHMKPITEYGGVAFVSARSFSGSTASFARSKYDQLFGKTSATLFLVDMKNRKLYIQSGGSIYSTVTTEKAETITDNVYRLASKSRYYECAAKVYDQIARILSGGLIPEPMKHLSNALLSIVLALLVVFIIANARTRIKNVTESRVFDESADKKFTVGEPKSLVVISEKKTRHVESSGGGSGGHSGGGGHYSGGGGGFSGGGGGGFSSGGGGHGF